MTEIERGLTDNFTELTRALSRMDLDLLPSLMAKRTELVSAVALSLEKANDNFDRVEQLMSTVRLQNFSLTARLQSRATTRHDELRRLTKASRQQQAYSAEIARSGGQFRNTGKAYG